MRVRHLLEADRKKLGRDLNHLEDLVLFYGSDGLREAIDILRDVLVREQALAIKWDGKVALFYGRDENGVFGMGTKGSWAKNAPLTSADSAREYIQNGGKGEPWRHQMGQDFAYIFPLLEQSVPQGFNGYVTGDLLFSPALSPKIKSNNKIQFTPNKVTYIVNINSDIGEKINQAAIGIALHLQFPNWKSETKMSIPHDIVVELSSPRVFTIGPTYVPHTPKLPADNLHALELQLTKNGHVIDELIAARAGISDIPNILYTFNNQSVRARSPASAAAFFKWLETSAISSGKQAKLNAINAENPTYFKIAFDLYNTVKNLKNSIIDQLDNVDSDIVAMTGDQPGGEGYVDLKHSVKFVPRHKWAPE